MIEGYDKWSIPSSDDLGGTYILELHLVRASNTRAPSIVGIQLGTYLSANWVPSEAIQLAWFRHSWMDPAAAILPPGGVPYAFAKFANHSVGQPSLLGHSFAHSWIAGYIITTLWTSLN